MSALSSLKKYLKSKGQEINDEWYVKIETRKSGKSMGMTDNYYFSPEGKRFRSMIEVYRFLTTGDKFERDEKTRCLKIQKSSKITKFRVIFASEASIYQIFPDF